MSLTKDFSFNELEAMQLGQAIQNALREKCPLKLTVTRCAQTLEGILKEFSDEKQQLMEKYVVKNEEGEMQTIEGLETPPQSIADFQLNVPAEEAIKAFDEVSERKIDVKLPVISGEAKVLLGSDIVTLEEYLDINPDASGSLAFIYLKLTE